MLINIISVFPGLFQSVFAESMIKRALEKGLVDIRIHDLRDFSEDKHRRVDDSPYGGGPGMVMKPEPFFKAVRAVRKECPSKGRVILMSPQGLLLTQDKLKELSGEKNLIVLCGHYEGVDERVRAHLADEEISIGDYVLAGGEIPAMVMVDALVRLIPGVLNVSSLEEESFADGLLEYPQFTRPREYEGMCVPEILLSGDHENIRRWRYQEALKRTLKLRPDLLQKRGIIEREPDS
ncbi:MAG: tRNA (guanosine(37)-N1)-methyltransferase TrmD [Dethiobacter sp.]|nr:MAG: tRNA (guanosine(37)-N1)-methyltransferase TrmD [Dethiobacter sp.]